MHVVGMADNCPHLRGINENKCGMGHQRQAGIITLDTYDENRWCATWDRILKNFEGLLRKSENKETFGSKKSEYGYRHLSG